MNNLFERGDGADPQSVAVKAYLSGHSGIESSWSRERSEYLAQPQIDRWHNCREQGYVVSMRSRSLQKQINVAFFEHRNSDSICAVAWEQTTLNPPTIDSAQMGDIYKDKGDVSHAVSHGQAFEMADWIYKALESFWNQTAKQS